MAIITGAAGNLVAYMLNGQVDAVRSRIKRIFRGGTEEERSRSLRAAEEDSAALARRAASETDVRARWGVHLAAYLAEHPEVLPDLEDIAQSAPTAVEGMIVGEQHNHGSGTFIGRDNYGGITTPRES
ncbi:hypothetical protein ABZW11_13865 [Nonomuraea sp. NPDC004580]|uniref:hypothetical protein n=1 Tax=Nonomuraea sp. NPDC004580 TaxID=3154552 RepID=UPI0033BD35C7